MPATKKNHNTEWNDKVRLLSQSVGRPNACDPILALRAKEGEIHWAWCPTWSILLFIMIGLAIMTFVAIILFVTGGPGPLTVGIILLLIVVAVSCVIGNWRWNTNKRYAYALARGKREEARALWANIDESQQFRAKDVFFVTRYGGKELVVLRDGTLECHGSHKDDLFEGLGDGDELGVGELILGEGIPGMDSDNAAGSADNAADNHDIENNNNNNNNNNNITEESQNPSADTNAPSNSYTNGINVEIAPSSSAGGATTTDREQAAYDYEQECDV